MKRFRLRQSLLVLTACLLGSTGCNKLIDLTPDNISPVSGFYRTESDMKQALTGTYGNLRNIYNFYYQTTELPSDNARTFFESEAGLGIFDKLSWTASSGQLSTFWSNHYRTIANANVVLARLDNVPFAKASTKAQYAAEAKFLRALMYFNLVRHFGDVPLVLTEITTEAGAYTYLRTPTAQVYAQMEKDLVEAAPDLPATYTGGDIGRATQGAAKALLGEVYLYQKKWPQAEAKLAEVVTAGTYRLLPDVTKVFGLGNDNNAEILFAAQFVAGGFGEGNSFVHNFVPQPSTGITLVAGNSTSVGTLDLYNAFEPGDNRRSAFIGVFSPGSDTYYYAKKFIYSVALQNEGDNDWPIVRYADVLLMYAEALNNNGKTTDALTQLNAVRTRAGLAAKALTLSTADTQLAIEQERRVELCFEGFRWFDLIRWGKAVSTMQAFKARYTTLDPANSNMLPRPAIVLYPLPSRELALNPNLTQNPGY